MNKPSDFYIGTIDLFAILLPGAIATLLFYYASGLKMDTLLYTPERYSDFYNALLFLLSAYLLGHIISQFSSYIDEWIYNRYKSRIYNNQSRLNLVKQIRSNYHSVEKGEKYINNFEWSRARLLKEFPEAITEIERYMADSKFFRGLILILLVLAGVLIMKAYYAMATASALVAVFSLIRYIQKKRKATETVYKYVIYLENCPLPAEGAFRSKRPKIIDRQVSPLPVEYSDTVKFLTTGLENQYIHWSITKKSIWHSRHSLARQEMLYCLAGRGWLQYHDNTTGQDERIWLSPNSTISIPAGRILQIENPGSEALSLISSEKLR